MPKFIYSITRGHSKKIWSFECSNVLRADLIWFGVVWLLMLLVGCFLLERFELEDDVCVYRIVIVISPYYYIWIKIRIACLLLRQ